MPAGFMIVTGSHHAIMQNSHLSGTLRFLAGVLLTAALASAATVIIPTGVDWNRGGSLWIREDGADKYAGFAGVIYIQLNENGVLYNRDTLCVDLFTDIYLSQQYDTTVLRPDQVPQKHLTRVSWLIDNALLPTQNNTYTSTLPQLDWVVNAAQGAGIQLAIWDIVHDNGDGFFNGRVQAVINPQHPTDPAYSTDPAILAWAQAYESLSRLHTSDLGFVYDNVSPGNGMPAQMLAGPLFLDGGPTPPQATPEPVAYILVGSALFVLGYKGRRASRQ
jgi:hypothetical protein